MVQAMYATVLNLNTQACQAESIEARKARFKEALEGADKIIAGKIAGFEKNEKTIQDACQVWNIFAAPEYSFANPLDHNNHGAGDVRHLSEGAKAGIEEWLKGLSVHHPRTLIFPGSIAWKKSMTRNVEGYLQKKAAGKPLDRWSEEFHKREFRARQPTKQPREQKAISSVKALARDFMGKEAHAFEYNGRYKIMGYSEIRNLYYWEAAAGWMDPGDIFVDGVRCTASIEGAKEYSDGLNMKARTKLNELGGGAVTHMARNTSLIYLNGNKQAKYHKVGDYHEVLDGGGQTVYVPGNSVPTFTVDGIVYGMEICVDHILESLKTRLPSVKLPAVVVLMSAAVEFNRASLPNPNAMVIHACSHEAWSFVGRGGLPGVGATKVSPPNVTDYTVYEFVVGGRARANGVS